MLQRKMCQTIQGLFVLHLAERQHCRFWYGTFNVKQRLFFFYKVFFGRRLNTQERVKNIRIKI